MLFDRKDGWLQALEPLIAAIQKTPIIRYVSYPAGYKDYCQKGDIFRPQRPGRCPLCGGKGCLIAHGRYYRKELVSTYEKNFGTFWIYRFLCTNTRRTISIHPDFSHSRKRFLLHVVIYCLYECFMKGLSRYRVSHQERICTRTLSHWQRGFCSHAAAKSISCALHAHSPPGGCFGYLFMSHVSRNGFLSACSEAARVMVRLHHDFSTALY